MRETRNAQTSIFHFYAPHALGDQLSMLSDLLDEHPLILDCVERDFRVPDTAATGANGLSVESVFRCLLLKQILKITYEKLSFHLSDSPTYRTFARLQEDQFAVVPAFNALSVISGRKRLNRSTKYSCRGCLNRTR